MKRFLLFLTAVTAHAGDRSSAHYAIAADDTGAAGQRASSAWYTADQSVSDSGAAGEAADYQALQGYTGQLYDPAGLTLTATPASVSETATSQLGAVIVNDDNSLTPVAASSVTWSVVSGPAAGISAGGMLTPEAVYANSPARVSGRLDNLTAYADLTILDTNPDNFHNYAADGIPDSWQAGYFGPDNPAGVAGADPDADGQDNLLEYLAGAVPNNPLSLFEISIAEAGPSRKNIAFSPAADGRTYLLESSADLIGWTPVPDVFQLNDDGHSRILQDRRATEARKFYRITISIP